MHTLVKQDDGKGWSVAVSCGGGETLPYIEVDMRRVDAMELVNYLNGGTGDKPEALQRIKETIEGS